MKNEDRLQDILNGNLEEALSFWEQIVDMGGQCGDLTAMRELASYLGSAFKDLGLKTSFIETGENYPPVFIAETEAAKNEPPVLFSGHYDTVFPFASYAHPAFRIEGDKAYGPGVLDMKGGIAITWLILKTLKDMGGESIPCRVVLVGDEETDRVGCQTGRILKEISAGCRFAFNMETGVIDRSVCIGRKGVEEYVVTVTGVSSHPGNHFERGRNAIEEAARKIILMQELTAPDFSYTVNIGAISGGTVSNRIPDYCQFRMETRFSREADRRYLAEKLQKICALKFIDGTATKLQSNGVLAPFETRGKEEALYAYIVRTAEKYGLKTPDKRILGGASDAANISETDTPVLCSMGVCGEYNHSPDEYADVTSFLERAELLLHAVLDRAEFNFVYTGERKKK